MTKPKRTSKSKHQFRLHHYLPLVTALVLVFGIVMMCGRMITNSYADDVIPAKYWLEYGRSSRNFVLIAFLISLPTLILLLGIQLKLKKYISSVFIGIAVFLLAGYSGLTFLSLPSQVTLFGEVKHYQTLETDNHIYHADSTWQLGIGGASKAGFYLWQCNKQASDCKRIYSYITPPIFTDGEYHQTKVEIQLQSEMIQLLINGDVVYAENS